MRVLVIIEQDNVASSLGRDIKPWDPGTLRLVMAVKEPRTLFTEEGGGVSLCFWFRNITPVFLGYAAAGFGRASQSQISCETSKSQFKC